MLELKQDGASFIVCKAFWFCSVLFFRKQRNTSNIQIQALNIEGISRSLKWFLFNYVAPFELGMCYVLRACT